MSRTLKWILLVVTVGAAAIWVYSWWSSRDQRALMKQGVTYEILSGQDGSFEWMYFYISRNGKRIDGPVITGSDLDLKLRYLHPGDTPEIVLWSEDYGATYLVMKPNLTDPKKPGFEILEDQNLGVWYPPLGYNNQE